MFWTRQLFAEAVLHPIRSILNQSKRAACAKFQNRLNTFRQALTITLCGNNSIQNCFNGVQFVTAKSQRIFAAGFQRLTDVDQLAVHARANQPLFLQCFKNILMETFARANDRGRQHDAFARKRIQNCVRDLRGAHGRDFTTAYFSVVTAVPTRGSAATRPQ